MRACPTPTTDAPPARGDYAAVWTGSEMIVWGAYVDQYGAEPTNAGGRYNPASDSWVAITTPRAWTSRRRWREWRTRSRD